MSESIVPVAIQKTVDRKLLIEWSDGYQQTVSNKLLRDSCPCATCMDKRMKSVIAEPAASGQLRILSAAEAQPLEIAVMQPVGNYAYNIRFSDEHTTGIYTLDLLRSLGSESESG